ncbi:MAG: sigma 54-interacting transcriptional regulator [Polyangiaceae bacterium]|nr:sigma 54-interacting transcriptional regulator [Polyangiaceae bacterium]
MLATLVGDAGSFEITAALGQGASSTVWETTDARGQRLALKVASAPKHDHRLATEAECLLSASSPYLPDFYRAGRILRSDPELQLTPGRAFILLGHAAGQPGSPSAALSELSMLQITRCVAHALSSLHQNDRAHGDIKPDNLLIDDNGITTVIDLGLSSTSELRQPEGATPRYLPPELWSGFGDAQSRDLWALGRCLAELAIPSLRKQPGTTHVDSSKLPRSLAEIITSLLSDSPHQRSSASWVARRAELALEQLGQPPAATAVHHAQIRGAYLRLRRSDIARAARAQKITNSVEGIAGQWLQQQSERLSSVLTLQGLPCTGAVSELTDLDSLGRRRLLTAVVGRSAASFPRLPFDSDSELVDVLLRQSREIAPQRLRVGDLLEQSSSRAPRAACDPLQLGIRLASAVWDEDAIEQAESLLLADSPHQTLGLLLSRRLRLRGELQRAAGIASRLSGTAATLELADILRRQGLAESCEALLKPLRNSEPRDSTAHADVCGLQARLAFDRGDSRNAERLLGAADETARQQSRTWLECETLLQLGRQEWHQASVTGSQLHSIAVYDDERARAVALDANRFHATGRNEEARQGFGAAADFAARSGAVLEEATYLTGVAAAAADGGQLQQALEAGERSLLLFESLGKSRQAARAALSRAVCFSLLGATEQTQTAADDAISRGKLAGDDVCRAYAHLALADVLGARDSQAVEHAERAQSLLGEMTPADRLRVGARLLRRGAHVDTIAGDEYARDRNIAPDARLDWWGARAASWSAEQGPSHELTAQLSALCSTQAPLASRAPALAAGAALAAQCGDGESAQRLSVAASALARQLEEGAPAELKSLVRALPWVQSVHAPQRSEIVPEQLGHIETLVHALSRRDELRPLLEQVLDALVLWTGVERGILLLRAPGGRMVVRAARNIAREDLTGQQLELSRSLAQRAAESGEPVVAVDASGELPELHESVHALKLRSVLAVPLMAQGEVLGVAYLDDRVRRGAFGERELSWVKLVGALAATAIADARSQLTLRRAARRAQRAEAKLESTLARREGELEQVRAELGELHAHRGTRHPYSHIVGRSPTLTQLLKMVDRVAASDIPVLVLGESGSGKELIARAVHDNGRRSEAAFVTENCSAIPEGLLESTLFGHVRGAFTGAARSRAGLFQLADGGSLFLDEVGEMSHGMQTKLLRALESGEVRPVGAEANEQVDVRIIAATHQDLERMVKDGRFREDLYYRLNVVRLDVPSLRQRPEDIPELATALLKKHADGRQMTVSAAAMNRLTSYSWPGNIRQLENEIRRALVMADELILPEHLSDPVAAGNHDAAGPSGLRLRSRVDALETELIESALERTSGNQTRAAEILGISRFGLQKMTKRLNISVPAGRSLRRTSPGLTEH